MKRDYRAELKAAGDRLLERDRAMRDLAADLRISARDANQRANAMTWGSQPTAKARAEGQAEAYEEALALLEGSGQLREVRQ